MTWPTHTLFGISSLWLLIALPPEVIGYDFGTLSAVAALGALLPDMDASESKIKHLRLLGTLFKPFLLLAQIVHHSDQHRGLLHSLCGLAMVVVISAPLIWCVNIGVKNPTASILSLPKFLLQLTGQLYTLDKGS